MITGIDHIVLLCSSVEEGRQAYGALLGRSEDWRSSDPEGAASVMFQMEHVALELLSPQGNGPLADRLRQLLADQGPGLQTLVLASDDLEGDHKRFRRLGLAPTDIVEGSSFDATRGLGRHWRRFRLDDVQTGGLRTFVLQRATDDPLRAPAFGQNQITDLDHLVIATRNPERALGLFGAKLAFELTLDRTDQERQSRLLVFSAGESGIEVTSSRSDNTEPKPDRLWGITWRSVDIDAANSRLRDKGLNVSEVRKGIRPGTRVFTVRDGTLGVPSLVVAGDNRAG